MVSNKSFFPLKKKLDRNRCDWDRRWRPPDVQSKHFISHCSMTGKKEIEINICAGCSFVLFLLEEYFKASKEYRRFRNLCDTNHMRL